MFRPRAQVDVSRRSPRSTSILTRRHRIRPGDVNDFSVRNLSQIAETAEGSSRVMAILLAAVASISLLVGGIGIMNILLVSVTERTREIGLRMAIGARRTHVLLQFLAEAVLPERERRHCWHYRRRAALGFISMFSHWPAPISLAAIAGGFLIRGGGRDFFRLLSGAKGRAARSDRGAAL